MLCLTAAESRTATLKNTMSGPMHYYQLKYDSGAVIEAQT